MTNLFIVNRERPELFDRLRAHFKDEPEAEILLDRRPGERRRAQRRREPRPGERDRRFFERRGALPGGTSRGLEEPVVASTTDSRRPLTPCRLPA